MSLKQAPETKESNRTCSEERSCISGRAQSKAGCRGSAGVLQGMGEEPPQGRNRRGSSCWEVQCRSGEAGVQAGGAVRGSKVDRPEGCLSLHCVCPRRYQKTSGKPAEAKNPRPVSGGCTEGRGWRQPLLRPG